MGRKEEDKTKSPFDSNSEDETIALSKDELDNILSEAEIVQDTSTGTEPTGSPAEQKEEYPEEDQVPNVETSEESDISEEEEFDISKEIDELSPEDVQDIELGEEEVENYEQELNEKLGEYAPEEQTTEGAGPEYEEYEEKDEIDLGEETTEEELDRELQDLNLENMPLEAEEEEDMDLDSYLKSVKSDIDLDSLELEEETEENLMEPASGEGSTESPSEKEETSGGEEEEFSLEGEPSLEEEIKEEEPEAEARPSSEDKTEIEAEQAFKEAGIEEPEQETPGTEAEQAPSGENEYAEQEYDISEQPFEGEKSLTEEEENLLDQDLEWEKEPEEPSGEEVVSVTGEELSRLEQESAVDRELLNDITTVLQYMDGLLGDLPQEKIKEFSNSEYFPLYKRVFEKLGLR
ncbi:MAG: hypothetical protein ACOC7U_01140 [Spirochaetota bacterium]